MELRNPDTSFARPGKSQRSIHFPCYLATNPLRVTDLRIDPAASFCAGLQILSVPNSNILGEEHIQMLN